MSSSRRAASAIALAALFLLPGPATSGAVAPLPAPSFDPSGSRSECEEKGGTVQERRAAWNTNGDPSSWLLLNNGIELCRFQTLGPEDDSRIYVDMRTLTAHEPTLAAVAYLSKVPFADGPLTGNPATAYCAQLGGSSSFGGGAAGGGWVNMDDPIDTIVAMCVFPDGSMIDEWGITYYAGGAVRGADLALVLDYQPGDQLPPIFE